MNVAGIASVHDLTVTSASPGAPPVDMSRLDVQPVVGHVPAAVWTITDQPTATAAVVPVLAGLVVSGQPRVADDQGRPPISMEVIDFNADPVPIGLVAPAPPTGRQPCPRPGLAELATQASGSRLDRGRGHGPWPGRGRRPGPGPGSTRHPSAPARLRGPLPRPPVLAAPGGDPGCVAGHRTPAGNESRAHQPRPRPRGRHPDRRGEAGRPRPSAGPAYWPGWSPPLPRCRRRPPAPAPPPGATPAGPATRAAVTGRTLVAAEWGASMPGAPQADRLGTALAGVGSPLAPANCRYGPARRRRRRPLAGVGTGGRRPRRFLGPGRPAPPGRRGRAGRTRRWRWPHPRTRPASPSARSARRRRAPPHRRCAGGSRVPCSPRWRGPPCWPLAPPSTCRRRWSPGATACAPARPWCGRPPRWPAGARSRAAARHRRDGRRHRRCACRARPRRAAGRGRRRRDACEPTVVAAGHRLHLVYAIPGDPGRAALAVRVTSGAGWRLAGVLGGPGTVDDGPRRDHRRRVGVASRRRRRRHRDRPPPGTDPPGGA